MKRNHPHTSELSHISSSFVLPLIASDEIISRLACYPSVMDKLAAWPSKLVDICGAQPVAATTQPNERAGQRIDRIRFALTDPNQTQFTGRGDREKVLRIFDTFVAKVTLAVVTLESSGSADEPREVSARLTLNTLELDL